jgi:hypothetical protein
MTTLDHPKTSAVTATAPRKQLAEFLSVLRRFQ